MCDMPDFCHQDFVISRKQYKCCECGVKIEKGQQYQKTSGKWNGEIDTFKRCMRCVNLSSDMQNAGIEDDCGGHPFGYLYDHVYENWLEGGFPMEHLSGDDLMKWADEAIEKMQNEGEPWNENTEFCSMGALNDYHYNLKYSHNKAVPEPFELCIQSGVLVYDERYLDYIVKPSGKLYYKSMFSGEPVYPKVGV